MKRMLTIATLLFTCWSAAALAAPVELTKASSRTGGKYGYSWQDFSFEIQVDNLAFAKQVDIYYRDSDGQWKTKAATFLRSAATNKELWSTSWVRALNGPYEANPVLDIEFAVKYQVNGQTYWDNNGGKNFKLKANSGELITRPVLADGATAVAPYDYNYDGNTGHVDGYLSVGALVQNLAFAKEVKVHYSYDNWATSHVGNAIFQNNRMVGYSNVSYPNSNNVEFWSFYTNGPTAQNATATTVKYAVSYKVNGVTYWDNNYGQNYSLSITKY